MQLSDIRTEVKDRGFDFVPDSRINRWVNLGLQRLYDREAWPFLETTTSGTAPLTITDVRAVLSVINTTDKSHVTWRDRRSIREEDPTLALTGTPLYWYLDGDALTVYPANTSDTLNVLYLKEASDLTNDSDTPLLPDRWHYLAVDLAVLEAYKDTDNAESWNFLKAIVEEDIARMGAALLVQNYDSAAEITRSMWG